ncbi:putative phage abortive infection protein, partial [Brevibacillus brevis]|uniref:putative phage abortive infection protein n=1 Tax=Brevibacillus brevis TaxID=1393 RepID=UPI001F3A923C
FEQTFFHMLTLHNDIVDKMKFSSVAGRSCFPVLFDSLKSAYTKTTSDEQRIEKAYDRFHKNSQHYIGHYFRNMYRIIKFIDESHFLTNNEKSNYCDIVRAQLSSYELALLMYNGLSTQGKG